MNTDILPDSPDARSLGGVNNEWLNLYIGDAGKLYFGLLQDVNLYRSAADYLRTDDSFVVMSNLYAGGDYKTCLNTLGYLWFGDGISAWDTDLYRYGANVLKTDGSFICSDTLLMSVPSSDKYITAQTFSDDRIGLYIVRSKVGGSYNVGWVEYINVDSQDLYFYNNIAGYNVSILRTTGQLELASGLTIGSVTGLGIITTARGGYDTYRWICNPLTNEAFLVQNYTDTVNLMTITHDGQLQLPVQGSGAGLLIGGDVNLYRSAADLLRTDDIFQAGGYKSSDGTDGMTGTVANPTSITIKNGLVTACS